MKLVPSPTDVAEALASFSVTPEDLEPTVAERDALLTKKPLSNAEKESLYAEVAKLKASQEAIEERLDQIKNAFRADAVTADGKVDYGSQLVHAAAGGKVGIEHNTIWNELRFLEAYPYDKQVVADVIEEDVRGKKRIVQKVTYPNRELYKITVDRPVAKSKLGEELYKTFTDDGTAKVVFR